MGINTETVQKLYVAFFNRPADVLGLTFWENKIAGGMTEAQIAASFAQSSEYTSLFTGMNQLQIVSTLYTNLFGRSASLAEANFWAQRMLNGLETVDTIALTLANSAQGTDADAISNKVTAATSFTDALDTLEEANGYSGSSANAVARNWLAGVKDTADSLTTATSTMTTTVVSAVNAGTSTAGSTFTLTAAADNVTGTSNNDSIVGTLPFAAGALDDAATLTAGDQINGGNGTDTLSLTISGANVANATVATPVLTSIEKVRVSNVATEAGDVPAIDLSLADSSLTSVGTSGSTTAGAVTQFSNINKIVDVEMAGRGNLVVDFASGVTSGTTDSLNVTLNGVGSSTANATLTVTTAGGNGAVETVNLASSTSSNYVTLTDSGVKTVNITGDKAISASLGGNASLTSVDASAATGAVTVDISSIALANITVKGGAGTSDTLTTDQTVAAVADLENVSGFETLKVTGANSVTLAGDVTGLSKFNFSEAGDQTLTLNTGYTADTTVTLTGDAGANADKVVNNANVALTVVANVADIDGTTTITGGTGTDALTLTADDGTATLTNVSGVETITLVANSTDAAKDASITVGGGDGTVASGKTLTVDASALTSSSATLTFTGTGETNGNFNVTGGAGKDTIIGGSGNDILAGGAGNDSIEAGAGNDSISGGDGNDTIVLAGNLTSADTIDGGSGTDTLSISALSTSDALKNVTNVEVVAITGAASVTLSSALSTAVTFDFSDTGDQALTLATGYTGATTVKLTGDATANADKVVNSANVALTVIANVADVDATTTITGGTGTDALTLTADSGSADLTAVSGVETITLVANSTDATKTATITVGGADGTVASGKTLTVDASALTNVNATLTFTGTGETDGNFNVTGGAGNDTITGAAGNDILAGGSGNDSLVGAAGNDSINGGDGNDTIDMAGNLAFDDTIDGGSGTDTLKISGGGTYGNNGEFAKVTNVETLAVAGATTLNVGSSMIGFNSFDLSDTGDQIVNLNPGFTGDTTVTLTGDSTANADKVVNTANVTLTVKANVADIDATTTITGGTGTDSLTLKADSGSADLTAVTGVESITLTANSANTATITTADATIASGKTLAVDASALTDASASLSLNASAETNGKLSVTGGSGNDVIVTGAGADTVSGGTGDDYINTGAGIDSITTGAGADLVKINTNSNKLTFATVTDFASGDALTATGNGTGVFTTTKVSLVAAATFSDYIDASASGDGSANSAWKWFQYGGNTYVVVDNSNSNTFQANTDAIIELTGAIDLSTGVTFGTSGTTGTLTLASSATTTGAGFFGTSGADSFIGGPANDKFTIDSSVLTDADTITGNAGTDTLNITGNTALTITFDGDLTGVENVVLANTTTNVSITTNDANVAAAASMSVNGSSLTTGTFTFNGSAETNGTFSITGGAGADTITGGAGADTITGGSGADSISGGLGADSIVLTESVAASDLVVISGGLTLDTVTGFTTGAGGDKIQLGIAALETAGAVEAAITISLDDLVDGTTAIGAGAANIQEVADQAGGAAVAAAGARTVYVLLDETYANLAAVETGLETGDHELTVHADAAQHDGFIVVWSDGTDTHVSMVRIAVDSGANLASGDLVATDLAKIVGTGTITAGEFHADNFAFIA